MDRRTVPRPDTGFLRSEAGDGASESFEEGCPRPDTGSPRSEALSEGWMPRALRGGAALTPYARKERASAADPSGQGGRRLLRGDWLYPGKLIERLERPPPALYTAGNAELLGRPLFCVANSNGASEGALEAADRAALDLMEAGYLPVTGHNRAAYQRPALLAARRGSCVVTVLDRGLREALGERYRKGLFAAARIWSPQFDDERELAVTRHPDGFHGGGRNNRLRDELVFALADVVIAGELRKGGEMERRCLEALRRGQEVRRV